jgi:hypothetical protein
MRPPVYVMGDPHGYYGHVVQLLGDEGLINPQLRWAGDNATLVFMGDFFDRGPDGISLIDLVMRLELEAREAGGEVLSLLGNHDVNILGARFYGQKHFVFENWSGDFYSDWLQFGGRLTDLERLTQRHIDWLSVLPAMLLVDNRRFIHADALFYYDYGKSAPDVNKAIRAVMRRRNPREWDKLLAGFSVRDAFADGNPDGRENALAFLAQYGGYGIVHGHTPVSHFTGQWPESVREAFVYAGGLCVSVDGGIYKGGPGFLYRLPPL